MSQHGVSWFKPFEGWEKDENQIRNLTVCSLSSAITYSSCERFSVIEFSGDGLKVRCTICLAGKQNGDGWINKGSIGNHLKSENHAKSLEAREVEKSKAKAGEQTMREESAMEEHLDFILLSLTKQPEVTTTARAPQQSEEEEQMWDRFTLYFTLPHLFHVESTWTPYIHLDSTWTPSGKDLNLQFCIKSIWSPYGLHLDSKWPPDGKSPLYVT